MTIYHFKNDSELLRTEILPSKKFFIIDVYKTLLLDEPTKGRKALRHGTIDFLQSWSQEKVVFSDGKKDPLIEELEKYELMSFFSKIYHSKHIDFFGKGGKMPKDYEDVARSHGYSIDEAIVFEDWKPDDPRLTALDIDFALIPTPLDTFNAICTGKGVHEAVREIRKINGYTFSRLLPHRN